MAAALFIVFGLLGILWAFVNIRKRRPVCLQDAKFKLWSGAALRRRDPPPDALTVIQQVRLTPTHQLHLVGRGQKRFLVCTHPEGCTSIALASDEPAQRQSPEWPDKGLNDVA